MPATGPGRPPSSWLRLLPEGGIRRFRPEGVRPLEIWDAPAGEGKLHERIGAPLLDAVAGDPERGEARAVELLLEALVPFLRRLHAEHAFEVAFLGGGLTLLEGLPPALPAAEPFALQLSGHGRFAAAPGGRAILARIGRPRGVVVDVGQTSVKVSAPARRTLVEREDGRSDVASVADAIVRGIPAEGDAAMVLALPCELDDALVPGNSTYAGWEGDAGLVPRLVQAVRDRLPDRHPLRGDDAAFLVLNDAELVAVSGACELPGRKLVALTLGHGPGAALHGC